MPTSDFNISRFLFGSIDPSLWECPIQYGIPFILNRGLGLMLYVAALALLFGIIASAYQHMTAFGDEEKAKKARMTLVWTIGGALVILFSNFLIYGVANYFIEEDRVIFPESGAPALESQPEVIARCNPVAQEQSLRTGE